MGEDDKDMRFLLSSNMTYADRWNLTRLWEAHRRVEGMSWFAGYWLSAELMIRHSYFRKMAVGWRCLAFFGMAQVFKFPLNYHASYTYAPLIGAYLRKYQEHSANDMFEISDRRREFYQIDTSQYMDYTEDSLREAGAIHMHVNHGPQPDGEAQDSSWLTELDKFLSNEPNDLKSHPKYFASEYALSDKSFPSVEQAEALMH